MPYLRGITVHVTDLHGNDLQEWGIQYLRQHTEEKRVSAYVQSITDVSFQVSVQPNIPFIAHVPSSDTSRGGNLTAKKKPGRLKASSEDRSTNQKYGKLSSKTLSSPVRPSTAPQSHPAPDFAFLALLYLDGRRLPERRIIVYTDPADKDFSPPDGKVAFKHRWVQSADGRMTEHAWVFKEKAIETVFDRLVIAGSQANVEDEDDDTLIKAMESSAFDAQEKPEKESKVGQIVVELRRIVLGEKRTEVNYRSHHQEGQDEDVDMEGVRRDITHATGFVHKNTLSSQPLRVVDYRPYKPNEGIYATFQFFYRSREQLKQFQFPGFLHPTTSAARTPRLLNARMAELTPLSISRPLDRNTKETQCNQDSYEAKVKKRCVKLDDNQRHDFGSDYRDVRAMSPSIVEGADEGKKPSNYPAAPLPFLANAPIAETRKPIIPSITQGPRTAAEIKSKVSNFITRTPGYHLELDHRARPSLFTNPDSPTYLGAEASSPPPSPTGFSKEQMANITKKDSYRPNAGNSYRSDQEEVADDEHATESDLETHAGDDDFDYAANPEEEDEGYDSLQSQFKNVRIRKRQRDDVEVAEDDNEAWQGADIAHLNGDGMQKTPKLPLTGEERANRGKKSRTGKKISAADSGQDSHGTEKTEEGGAT